MDHNLQNENIALKARLFDQIEASNNMQNALLQIQQVTGYDGADLQELVNSVKKLSELGDEKPKIKQVENG